MSQCEPKTNEKTLVATGELFLDQLLSQSRIEACVQLTPALPPTAAGAEGEERPAPMLLVAAEVSQPLVEAEELDPEDGGLRILDLKLDGLRRLPPSWLAPLEVPGSEYPYSYAAHAAIPLGNGEEYLVRFGGGALVVRRPATTGAPADDSAPPPGEADGAAEGAAGGEAAESSVEWAADPSAPARCILPAASARHLLEALDAGAPVRIRFSRVLDRAELKEPETNAAKWAAVCEAQLEPLAALDARTASATCALAPEFPPTEEALAEEEAAKGKEKPKGKEPPAKGKGAKDKGGAPTLLAREPAELPHPYEKCGTLLLLTASTDRPLFPRPPAPPPPVPTVSQLLPQRVLPSLLPKTANAEFEGQVKAAVKELLAQFADAFGAAPLEDGSAEAREARRRELLYALNNSGAYFALKERLKKAVVRIVRESFGKTDEAQLPPGGQTDRFHADLYAHLLGLAHAALHAAFYPPAPEGGDAATAAGRAAVAAAMGGMKAGGKLRAPVVPSSEARLPQLRRLADEMEAERRWEACAALHEERLCLAESDGELWREYGLLLLRANERPKAEAALREALALSPRDTAALTAYAAALFCRGRLDEAEVRAREREGGGSSARRALCARPPASLASPLWRPVRLRRAPAPPAHAATLTRPRRPRAAPTRRAVLLQGGGRPLARLGGRARGARPALRRAGPSQVWQPRARARGLALRRARLGPAGAGRVAAALLRARDGRGGARRARGLPRAQACRRRATRRAVPRAPLPRARARGFAPL